MVIETGLTTHQIIRHGVLNGYLRPPTQITLGETLPAESNLLVKLISRRPKYNPRVFNRFSMDFDLDSRHRFLFSARQENLYLGIEGLQGSEKPDIDEVGLVAVVWKLKGADNAAYQLRFIPLLPSQDIIPRMTTPFKAFPAGERTHSYWGIRIPREELPDEIVLWSPGKVWPVEDLTGEVIAQAIDISAPRSLPASLWGWHLPDEDKWMRFLHANESRLQSDILQVFQKKEVNSLV